MEPRVVYMIQVTYIKDASYKPGGRTEISRSEPVVLLRDKPMEEGFDTLVSRLLKETGHDMQRTIDLLSQEHGFTIPGCLRVIVADKEFINVG